MTSLSAISLPARLEAILYLKGRCLSLAELSELAGVSRDEVELALITLMADYAHRDTALEIRQDNEGYSLQLRTDLAALVQELVLADLSTACLRTLATVALKKRLLQSELVIYGSGAYDHIKELLERGFIERKRQSDGRSYWISLTEKFHRTFDFNAGGSWIDSAISSFMDLSFLLGVLAQTLSIYTVVLIVRVLLSWFPNLDWGNPVLSAVSSIPTLI